MAEKEQEAVMAGGKLASIRKDLTKVRGFWDNKLTERDALSKAAMELGVPETFRSCARSATPIVECYAKMGDDLRRAYKALWGTAGGK